MSKTKKDKIRFAIKVEDMPKERNVMAMQAFLRNGAGYHSPKGYNRKLKHKGQRGW